MNSPYVLIASVLLVTAATFLALKVLQGVWRFVLLGLAAAVLFLQVAVHGVLLVGLAATVGWDNRDLVYEAIAFGVSVVMVLGIAVAVPLSLSAGHSQKTPDRRDDQFQTIARATNDAVWIWDLGANSVWWNEALHRLFGYAGDQVSPSIEWRMEKVHPDDRERILAGMHRVIDAVEEFWTDEYRFQRADGSYANVSDQGYVTRDEAGRPVTMIGAMMDISRRKHTEQALADRTRDLERINKELLAKNQSLDEFTYMASHDLQEPLRKLISFNDLLREDLGDDLGEEAKSDLHFMAEAVQQMQNLVQDLLELSRAGMAAMKIKKFPLRECADRALAALSTQIEDKRAKIARDDLPEIWGDASQLTQLYQNLISNALKFTVGVLPEIHLTRQNRGGRMVLGVKDNGIGINPAHMEQLFAPFKRLHGRSEFEGSGIGLAICRKIVERHGGRIWVESAPGKGSHFMFTLNQEELQEQHDREAAAETGRHSPG